MQTPPSMISDDQLSAIVTAFAVAAYPHDTEAACKMAVSLVDRILLPRQVADVLTFVPPAASAEDIAETFQQASADQDEMEAGTL